VIGLIYVLIKKLPKNAFISKDTLKVDYALIVLAQYISIMNVFYFNLSIIA